MEYAACTSYHASFVKFGAGRILYSVLSLQEPIDKKGTLFHLLQTNVIAR